MSASNIRGCYIVNGTGAFNKSILLISPADTFDAREFSIQTRIIGRIAVTNFRTDVKQGDLHSIVTYVVPSTTKLSMIPWAAARPADPTKTRKDRIFSLISIRI
jgi:hypothetical protein